MDDASRLRQLLTLLRGAVGVKDMDGMRLQIPSWVHEGDSALERGASMETPTFFSQIAEGPTPLERMVRVTRFLLSNLKTQMKTKRKPFNPILGEQFLCSWPGTPIKFYSEQVSHHPPMSAFTYEDPTKGINYTGATQAILSFTGSAFKITFKGHHRISLQSPPGSPGVQEEYLFSMPFFLIRGILLGDTWADFNGEMVISCPQTSCQAVLHFLEKPLIGGEIRRTQGKIYDGSGALRYEISGRWDTRLSQRDVRTGENRVIFDAGMTELVVKPQAPTLEQQGEMESQRIWHDCAVALRQEKWKLADRAKHQIEELQRRYHREMEKGLVPRHRPVFFDLVDEEEMRFKFVGVEEASRRVPWLRHYHHILEREGEKELF
jgi:hypothetical protein